VLPVGTEHLVVHGAISVAAHCRQDGHREISRLGQGSGPLQPWPAGQLPALHDCSPNFP